MSTTALFVEILVTGIQSLVLLAILVHAWWDLRPLLNVLPAYKEYAALITTLVLAAAYSLGIIVDRLADTLGKAVLFSNPGAFPEPIGKVRLRIMNESEGMAKFLDYQRSRLRIARSTLFNLFLLIIAGSISLIWRSSVRWPVIILIVGSGAIAFYIVLKATRAIENAQMKRLQDAYQIIEEKRSKE